MRIGKITDTSDGDVPIYRGYMWPPGGAERTITLTNSDGWTPGQEDNWTWQLDFSPNRDGDDPMMSVPANSVTITGTSDEDLVLKFNMEPAQTSQMPGSGPTVMEVDLVSDDGSSQSIWAVGKAVVRDSV